MDLKDFLCILRGTNALEWVQKHERKDLWSDERFYALEGVQNA